MSLREATNAAAEFVKAKDFIAAITTCYDPFYNEFFGGGAGQEARFEFRDRFLAEYIDACVLATVQQGVSPTLTTQYFQRVLALAEKYFEEFSKQDSKPLSQRAQTVVSNLMTASIKLGKQDDLLVSLERISLALPDAFRPALLNEWEKLLKSDPGFQRKLEDSEIRDRLDKEPEYRSHWSAYEDFLRVYEKVPMMKTEARRRLAKLPRVSTT